jgi:hypothetical protein
VKLIKVEIDAFLAIFLANIAKCKATLGLQGSEKTFANPVSKVKWSQHIAGQATQFYEEIFREIDKLQLLLGYHNLQV